MPSRNFDGEDENGKLCSGNRYKMEERKRPKPLLFELHGSQFENRAPDRANRKFKMHIDPDL